ncbi:TPA: hypothetical protein QEM76_005129 [Pseudomonas putida]|nr:hypothetical protein [Pseudomonas aeruginosa]HCF5337885.1 hypothetical protein [Pseudomonas aeruginosa]HDS1802316.1 hypothetical protein [Pseudomonas putida]HDS1808355.1 hypothetical protein [Pseudomonas putida]
MSIKQQESPRLIGTLAFLGVSFFIFLLLKNSGLYPRIFGDEYTYSLYSRLIPFAESKIPGYLYLFIYRFTSHCGVDFLSCARIFNALFFVGAAPFIYLVARRIANPLPAAWVTGLTLLGPINLYTAHYMPEPLYFFGFWVLVWALLRSRVESLVDWLVIGLIFGCTALIKPHSLLFMPAMLVYIGYLSFMAPQQGLRLALRNLAAFTVVALLAKFLISYLLAGKAGLTLFGTSYGEVVDSATTTQRSYVDLLLRALSSIQGHLLALCLMLGLPMAMTLGVVVKTLGNRVPAGDHRNLALFGTLLLGNLIAAVALFTASVSGVGPFETVSRLHMRYYDFAFGLLLILVLAQTHFPVEIPRKWRVLLALCVGLPALYAMYSYMLPYTPYYTDGPELRGFVEKKKIFYILGSLSLLCIGLWVFSTKAAQRAFLYLFMPLAVLLTSLNATQMQRHALVPDAADRAGEFARQYLSEEERGRVLIVNTDLGAAYRSLFYMDNAHTSVREIAPEVPFNMQDLPPSKDWVLLVGNNPIIGQTSVKVPMPGFTLARLNGPIKVEFAAGNRTDAISSARGLSTAESWGVWSSTDQVMLEFTRPLPKRLRLELVGHAFGPNVGKPFVLQIGEQRVPFEIGADDEHKVFEFDNPSSAQTLIIEVPEPRSPKDLGINEDNRQLGIGLNRLVIEPI